MLDKWSGTIRCGIKIMILLSVCCIFLPDIAYSKISQEKTIILDGQLQHRIGRHMEVLIDHNKEYSIKEVASRDLEDQFKEVDEDVPNLLKTNAAVWVRFSVSNAGSKLHLKYLSYEFPLVDQVSFFIPQSTGYKRLDAGHTMSRSAEMIPHRHYIFPFTIKSGQIMTCYLRVVSNTNMLLPLTIWEPAALDRKSYSDQMAFGIIFGIWVAFIAYFAGIALKLRNPAAIWFTIYIGCMGLLMACYHGHLQKILRPAISDLNQLFIVVIIGCLYFTGAKFFRVFLNIDFYSRRVDRIMIVLQWMGIGFIPMNIFVNPLTPLYSIILIGIGPLFSTSLSIYFWRKGVPNAKYFALGWIIGHITSEIDLLRTMGVLPHIFPGSTYMIPVAMISAIIFFSIAIIEQSRVYRENADKDGLTGIANRRYFNETMVIEWNRHRRNKWPLTIIIADIDDFKTYNDTYGHTRGDSCLRTLGQVFNKMMRRAGDLAARYGGEEFVMLLPATDSSKASVLAEKIRSSVQALAVKHAASRTARVVTVSIGTFTTVPDDKITISEFIDKADAALYSAKNKGRNCVVEG